MNDASRPAAKVVFNGASAERLGSIDGWDAYQELLDRAAVLMAFEQIGGAQACLDMAKSYALERYAFGRPIGSFRQALNTNLPMCTSPSNWRAPTLILARGHSTQGCRTTGSRSRC